MLFDIPIADIVVGIIALLLVGLCIYSVFRKKKKCCSKCSGCPYSKECDGSCNNSKK